MLIRQWFYILSGSDHLGKAKVSIDEFLLDSPPEFLTNEQRGYGSDDISARDLTHCGLMPGGKNKAIFML